MYLGQHLGLGVADFTEPPRSCGLSWGAKREAERGEWAEMAQDEGERKRILGREREEERESEKSREALGGTAWLGENPQENQVSRTVERERKLRRGNHTEKQERSMTELEEKLIARCRVRGKDKGETDESKQGTYRGRRRISEETSK